LLAIFPSDHQLKWFPIFLNSFADQSLISLLEHKIIFISLARDGVVVAEWDIIMIL
jgi:hypothetical protein